MATVSVSIVEGAKASVAILHPWQPKGALADGFGYPHVRVQDGPLPHCWNVIADPSDHALAALSRPFPPSIPKALLINGAGV